MKQRCPLTIRFGKDIAGLISWWVWKLNIKNVNNEYDKYVRDSDADAWYCYTQWWFYFIQYMLNLRHKHWISVGPPPIVAKRLE